MILHNLFFSIRERQLTEKFLPKSAAIINFVYLSLGSTEKAREILKNIDSVAPGYVSVRQARVGLEFRQRRFIQVEALYHGFLDDSTLTNEARNFYSWRYAKFAARVCESIGYCALCVCV